SRRRPRARSASATSPSSARASWPSSMPCRWSSVCSCTATPTASATTSITSTSTVPGPCATTCPSEAGHVSQAGGQRIALVGTGLVGGSVGLALRRAGVIVHAYDRDAGRLEQARELGAIDVGTATLEDAVRDADVVLVAVPVGHIADAVVAALDAGAPAVTDVGSVKAPIVAAVEAARPELSARFVGGHPMAGSEQDGLDGAEADLFVGATWVLTPTP